MSITALDTEVCCLVSSHSHNRSTTHAQTALGKTSHIDEGTNRDVAVTKNASIDGASLVTVILSTAAWHCGDKFQVD